MFNLPRWRFCWGANALMSAAATTGERWHSARSPTKPPVTQGNTSVPSAAAAVRVFSPDSSDQLSLKFISGCRTVAEVYSEKATMGRSACRRERKRLLFPPFLSPQAMRVSAMRFPRSRQNKNDRKCTCFETLMLTVLQKDESLISKIVS